MGSDLPLAISRSALSGTSQMRKQLVYIHGHPVVSPQLTKLIITLQVELHARARLSFRARLFRISTMLCDEFWVPSC